MGLQPCTDHTQWLLANGLVVPRIPIGPLLPPHFIPFNWKPKPVITLTPHYDLTQGEDTKLIPASNNPIQLPSLSPLATINIMTSPSSPSLLPLPLSQIQLLPPTHSNPLAPHNPNLFPFTPTSSPPLPITTNANPNIPTPGLCPPSFLAPASLNPTTPHQPLPVPPPSQPLLLATPIPTSFSPSRLIGSVTTIFPYLTPPTPHSPSARVLGKLYS